MKKEGFYTSVQKDLAACFKNKQELTYQEFFDALRSFRFTYDYDFSDLDVRLNEIKRVLHIIVSIINKPRTASSTDQVILRSEETRYVSNDSFLKTTKDPSLWKKKSGILEPEKVHTDETVDTIDTYENHFIITLISLLNEEINEIADEMNLASLSLMSKYRLESFSYSPFSLLGVYQDAHYPFKENFTLKKDVSSLEESLHDTNKLLRRIMGSSFYLKLKGGALIKNPMATNILVHNPLYSYCYKHYKHHLAGKEIDYPKEERIYYNYVLCAFFYFFKNVNPDLVESNKKGKLFSYEHDTLLFKPFSVKNKTFAYEFKQEGNKHTLGVDIKCLIGELNEEERVTRFLIKSVRKLLYPEYKKLIKENEKENTNLVIVSLFNPDNIYTGVLNLSYFTRDHLAMMKSLFTSFTLLYIVSSSSVKNRCFCCSSKEISHNNNIVSCHKCKSEYLTFSHLNNEYVLIKKPWKARQ